MVADTDWSAPGEMAGKPDRYQSRWLHGCHVTAGTNRLDHRGDLPWTCSLGLLTAAEAASVAEILKFEGGSPRKVTALPDPVAPSERLLVEVRGWGVTVEECRGRAETCAGIVSRRVASFRAEAARG